MKVASSPHSSLHPFHIRALYHPNLHLTDKEAGTSKFKQVGQDLISQSRVAGWPPRSSSELPGRAQVGRGRQLVRFTSQQGYG